MNNFVAYDLSEVRKNRALARVKTWHKANLVRETEMVTLREKFKSNLYSPTVTMKLFLFCTSILAMLFTLIPIAFSMELDFDNEIGWRAIFILLGLSVLILTETKFIKTSHHFKSGVTEAGYLGGISFFYIGVIGFDIDSTSALFSCLLFAMILFVAISIRYLDLISIVGAIICLIGILFIALEPIIELLPFAIILVFGGLFLLSQKLQQKVDDIIWIDHFIVFDSLSLLLVFMGGNYMVVRELSIEMMNLKLLDGEDIPFAFLFYFLTIGIPIFYLVYGILKRETLFTRMGLLCVALSVLTLVNYNFTDNLQITSAVIGGMMILISLGLMKYLKKNKNGYTREQILESKWDNSDLAAFVASQTLGGHQIKESEEAFVGKGGDFGGAGASGEF